MAITEILDNYVPLRAKITNEANGKVKIDLDLIKIIEIINKLNK